ncbi:MAG: hypothetical protein OXG74_00580 [Acidobacteria bacterium]|nr:hypothetical protein [Acidobacteriota bacterium]
MLLRASSDAVGAEVDLSAAVEEAADGGVEDGAVLTAFAEAVVRATDELDAARVRALKTLGPAKFVEAAATIGIFNGLVRVADSTGIPSDAMMLERTADVRGKLGFDSWSGAKRRGWR